LNLNCTWIYLLSFERSKERSKEKSPADDKLPEIHSYWRQKFQLTARQKSTDGRLKQEIFAIRQYSEFLFGNLSQAGFKKKNKEVNVELTTSILLSAKQI